MALSATIKNIGRKAEKIDGVSVAIGATTVVDLDDAQVRAELRNDADWVIVPDAGEDATLLELAGKAVAATFAAPTAEAADARGVSVQFKNSLGADLAEKVAVWGFLSTDAGGNTPGDGGLTVAVTAGVDGSLLLASGAAFLVESEADGDLDLVLTDAADGAGTVYVNLILPTGEIVTSAAVAFADDTP